MTALSTASSGGMVGEYDMSSRGHSYDFATATLSAEDVNVRVNFFVILNFGGNKSFLWDH